MKKVSPCISGWLPPEMVRRRVWGFEKGFSSWKTSCGSHITWSTFRILFFYGVLSSRQPANYKHAVAERANLISKYFPLQFHLLSRQRCEKAITVFSTVRRQTSRGPHVPVCFPNHQRCSNPSGAAVRRNKRLWNACRLARSLMLSQCVSVAGMLRWVLTGKCVYWRLHSSDPGQTFSCQHFSSPAW